MRVRITDIYVIVDVAIDADVASIIAHVFFSFSCNYIQVSQKNALSEFCWSHSALARSQVAGTLCVWKLIFLLFLIKTKPDQAFPSHVHGKI